MSESINVEVPTVGESISEVQIGQWFKQEGEWIAEGEDLVEIETEKASVQIPAPTSGTLQGVLKNSEDFATVGEIIASIAPSEKPSGDNQAKPTANAAPEASAADQATTKDAAANPDATGNNVGSAKFVMPAAERLIEEHGLDASVISATGPGGRLLKEDVLGFIEGNQGANPAPTLDTPKTSQAITAPPVPRALAVENQSHRSEEIKPLSMLRRTIAARLVEAQQTAALLTTFNEIDMQPVMSIRKKYQDRFVERHGVKLGFMSFFAKAAVEALRRYPAVNAEVQGDHVLYRHYQDIGVAIGGGKGLVVPILRNVERMSFAEIELTISDFVKKASENRIQADDLIGGTFTISNGGVYGSLLSTPIVNPPQSGILGLHSIQQRPIAVDGEVVIRPMMYVALTYDHRIVDGREAVSFLKTIKDVIEDPSRLFLEL
ncbi:2-oxoglutarate dehydrogenase complex dihydrolipoyllysine-residue succinyltransferase [Rhodopirellula sp.]|nr:2-oxoglutarate dehydrogenase complex dihydrolipoyllysine-residue succinyltransferase [Rhodopirellula sp.]MDB4679053.1 2-oxoglutarate dehydrogenase complex dihydrolipoyllysine-residue succinyltransferase [Rhodopirellula sp.]